MDKKARDILFKTYWSSAGWRNFDEPETAPADFAYAKEKGLMFDPITITKPELLAMLRDALDGISRKKVTDAFLCSLSNKRLDWRSGLGSYVNAHRLLTATYIDYYYSMGWEHIDLNIMNFERIKWGGVRHWMGIYNWLDLTLLQQEDIPTPTQQDVEIFKYILSAIDNSPTGEPLGRLKERLKDVYKSTKAERHLLVEILGCCDILKPLRHDRKEPGKHDWFFIAYWRGEDKYDKQNTQKYFGDYGIA